MVDFAVARAFVGARDDGQHLPGLSWSSGFGRVRFDWVVPFSSLPRRVAIKPPKLMFHGLYDEDTPLKTAGMPLFDLLPEPKQMNRFEGGHVPTPDLIFKNIHPYLDATMGPVKR